MNGNKKANAVRNSGVAVDNVQGGASVNKAGARPAQGTATTTDDGLVRMLERASLLECGWGVRRLCVGWTLKNGHRDGQPPKPSIIITF